MSRNGYKTPYKILQSNGESRAKDGCIITFENAEGGRLTRHRAGPPPGGRGRVV